MTQSVSAATATPTAQAAAIALAATPLAPAAQFCSPKQVFFCPEESQFYSQCLEKLVINPCTEPVTIVEFGAGDGSPVISCLLKSQFRGVVHGYELNPAACAVAREHIHQYELHNRYQIHNQCFFTAQAEQSAQVLIANPPYIPAPDNQISMPALHGGIDGATITKCLLELGCEQVLLMISAYSNPVDTIEHARSQGYRVADFMVTPLPFGYYSSEPKVRQWIDQLRRDQKAFYSANVYFLAGVLFQKNTIPTSPVDGVDLSTELIKVMTVL